MKELGEPASDDIFGDYRKGHRGVGVSRHHHLWTGAHLLILELKITIQAYLKGYDLSGLEDAVKKRFEEWMAEREGRRKRGTETEEELFIKFSDQVFGIKDPK